jgi:hypothetical protein
MATKRRPREKLFMLAPNVIWQEHKIPPEDSYVLDDGSLIAYSIQVVKAFQGKMIFVVKIGTA